MLSGFIIAIALVLGGLAVMRFGIFQIRKFKKFITSKEAKNLLKRNTDELIRRGGFGSPTFFYKEKMFFGNDRLHLLEDAIVKNLI